MIPRLHAPAPIASGDLLTLAPEEQHYLRQVLRAKLGDPVQVFDGLGRRFAGLVNDLSKSQLTITIERQLNTASATPLRIALIQSISTADKMDWTVEKATELGVVAIVPVLSQRSLVRLNSQRTQSKRDHWQRIALAACRQSGNDYVPEIAEPIALEKWLGQAARAEPPAAAKQRIVLCLPRGENTARRLSRWPIATPSTAPMQIDVLVGPEAGLSEAEIEAALACGFVCVSLGPRVLRTETAGLVAIALLQGQFGDL